MRASGFRPRFWLLLVSCSVAACGEDAIDASASGGVAGAVSGGAGVSGMAGGPGGTGSGSSGTGPAGAGGTNATGGAGHAGAAGTLVAAGTSGSAGASGVAGSAGALGGSGGAGQGGSVGGAGASGAGAVSGTAGAAGAAGASGTSGTGGDPCSGRTGGALIDVDVLGESMRFWTTNEAFIQEVEDSLGQIPGRIPLFELEDGSDCDAKWTFHLNPTSPRFEDDWIDICDVELSQIEGDKAFYLTNRDFCPRFMRVQNVDVR